MRALLWKEFRQNWMYLGIVVVLVVIPYLISGTLALTGSVVYMGNQWITSTTVCVFAFMMIAGALLGGVLAAGERSDRSAEFQKYLPISQAKIIGVKLFLGLGVLVVISVLISCIYGMANLSTLPTLELVNIATQSPAITRGDSETQQVVKTIFYINLQILSSFAGGWLAGVLIKNVLVSVGIGILMLGLSGTVAILSAFFIPDRYAPEDFLLRVWGITNGILFVLCLWAGSHISIKRVGT